jgi:hypothetical protein
MTVHSLPSSRPAAVRRVSRYLLNTGWPRLVMLTCLGLTGLVGFGASFALLRLGVTEMWVRYPAAALLAYGAFLGLLRIWAGYVLSRPDLIFALEQLETEPPEEHNDRSGPSVFDWLDLTFLPDDNFLLTLIIAVGVAVVAILGSALVFAPALLGELLLDAILVAGLWRRFSSGLRGPAGGSALRLTWLPALIVIVSLGLVGYWLQSGDPAVDSIGDVFR